MWQLRLTITIAVVILNCCAHSEHRSAPQHLPLAQNPNSIWRKPPNQRAFQRVMLQRMMYIMDIQADPCEDFYQFACGNYKNLAPAELRSIFDNPLDEVEALSEAAVKIYFSKVSGTVKNITRSERKIKDFLESCINSKNNLQSTADFVKSFGSWPALDSQWSVKSFDIWETIVKMAKADVESIYSFEYAASKRDRIDVGISSLVINKTEVFDLKTQTAERFTQKIKEVGENVISRAYLNDMILRVKAFFNQMQQIARNSEIKSEGNEFYSHELQRRAPSCDFAKLFSLITGRRYEATEMIIIPYIDYVENACQLIQRTEKRTLADLLLTFVLINDYEARIVSELDAAELKTHCEKEAKDLFTPVLTGMFARDYLPKETRQEAINLVKNLQKVGMKMMLSNTSWLDEPSRRRAAKKMETVTNVIGYPDYMASEEELWKVYSKVDIDTANYLQNRKLLNELRHDLAFDIIGKDIANSTYDPLAMSPRFEFNGRGILRVQVAALMPPVYHKFAPSFVKHSTVLSILGHELMHNFDVEGIDIDEHGKKSQWMTANRYLSYNYRSECIYSQYAKYKLDNSDIYINSSATMGENVADFDGLKLALELFKQWIAENPDKVWEEEFTFAPLQMTHEQAFFLSFGQLWCDSRGFDELVEQIGDDEHAPGKFRVIGPLSNLPDFAKAFNCPANSQMNPAEKCTYFFD